MRISVTPDGQGTPLFIAGGQSINDQPLTGPAGFSIDHGFNEQVVELLRADEIKIFDRGNHRTVITFDVHNMTNDLDSSSATYSKGQATLFDAWKYCVRGLIQLEGIFDGNVVANRYCRGIVKAKGTWVAGCSINLRFSILAGKLYTSAPIQT